MCQGTAECGNDVIEPGESCEEDLFLDGIIDCSDIPLDSSWEGDLICDDQCQIRQSTENPCETQGYDSGYNCVECEDCGDTIECDATICINYCGGNGACNYVGEPILGDQCIECTGTLECGEYEHPASCNYDVCNTLFNTGFTCEWSSVDNECNTNTNCEWNCDGLYDQCSGDGFAYKQSEFSCVLISGDCDAVNDNPALRYPGKIACGLNEENFPVFTLFNLIISLILIIGYYFVFKKKF